MVLIFLGVAYQKSMRNIVENLLQTQKRIHAAEQEYAREHGSVRLLAVSKGHNIDAIRLAAAAGQCEFGENYLQEALTKIQALHQENLSWHYIGPIQSNKTRLIAENFDWVHSIDRLKIAERISEARPADLPPLNVCIQVNISAEPSKAGIDATQASELAQKVAALPGLRLRGLMVIPAAESEFSSQRRPFAATRELLQSINKQGLALDTLSMGMSDDLEAAIAEGTTLVRVGTAIFGAR